MGNETFIQGNLALAIPAASARPALTVIDGGRRERAVSCVPPCQAASGRNGAASQRFALTVALVGVLIAVSVGFAFLRNHELVRAAAGIAYEEVTVAPGDSLWSIAEARPAAGLSTDDLVQIIQDRNGLERAGLEPGQVLLVPARQG